MDEGRRSGPAEFLIDAFGIEGVGLPHLEFVDGVRRDVVAADEPGLLGVPVLRSLLSRGRWVRAACASRGSGYESGSSI